MAPVGTLPDDGTLTNLRQQAWLQVDAAVTITDMDGVIVDWNDGATRLFGWTADEAIGSTWADLSGPVEADPDPRRVHVRERLDQGRGYTGELTVAIKGGERIPILVSGGLVRDDDGTPIGSVGIAIDDRRRSLAEERFEVVFRESPMASMITAGVGQLIVDANAAFEALSGFKRHEVIGRTSVELGIWDRPEDASAVFELTTRQRSLTDHPVRFRSARGDVVHARLSGRPINLSDGPAFLWMAVDETDRLRAEVQEDRAQRLESIGLLAGGVAHDFNNALTIIGGSASLALRQLSPGHPAIDDLEEIVRSADGAAGRARQLLAFSGRQVLQPESFDLAGSAQDMEAALLRLASPGTTVTVDRGDNPAWVHADPDQMRQVVHELAVNAFHAMPTGGSLRITVSTEPAPNEQGPTRVRLAIEDTGVGMDDETTARIFEPFFTTKSIGEGAGLGLAVAHGIIERSGGTITVDSRPNDGTTFRIDLPGIDAPAPRDVPMPNVLVADERGPTILLVEDESAIRALTRRVLEGLGHHVIEAEDGIAGLAAAGGLASLDLVLTDLIMPRMGGVEMAVTLGELYPAVPVVFMSGYGASSLAEDGIVDPSVRLLAKPFSIHDLTDMVQRTLAESTRP
ncbi:MAG: PAS domain S-box protein [Candidatus Limnocylindrales bacterium]